MESGMESEQIKKILITLAIAKSPVPLEYISLHTGIKEPLKILKKMEERGLVRKTPSLGWSCCLDPMHEITPKTKKELLNLTVKNAII
jgi:hypothetical protein